VVGGRGGMFCHALNLVPAMTHLAIRRCVVRFQRKFISLSFWERVSLNVVFGFVILRFGFANAWGVRLHLFDIGAFA
jgi:hypothetical protein